MKGSYLAKIVESDILREQHYKRLYMEKEYIRENCPKCINRGKDLCHIVKGIDGKLRCSNHKVEQNT